MGTQYWYYWESTTESRPSQKKVPGVQSSKTVSVLRGCQDANMPQDLNTLIFFKDRASEKSIPERNLFLKLSVCAVFCFLSPVWQFPSR